MKFTKNAVTVNAIVPAENKAKNEALQVDQRHDCKVCHTYDVGCVVWQFLQTTSRIKNRFIGGCPGALNSS